MNQQTESIGNFLDVGDGHQLYYEDWGNPAADVPILNIHGGPGSGFNDRHKTGFDPERQRVIFYDQRGAGRSTPFASTEHNTTQDLVSDITKLLRHLGIPKVQLFGTSWGSTLALCYAIQAPETVERMLLGGIFLARDKDMRYIYCDIKTFFPEVIGRFYAGIPEADRGDHKKILAFYHNAFQKAEGDELRKLVFEWNAHEGSLMALDYTPAATEMPAVEDFDEKGIALAKLEAHYFVNNSFLPENYILDNAAALRGIPAVIVHGRYDMVCAPEGAAALAATLGRQARLHMIMSGHNRRDTVMREVMAAYMHSFLA